MTPLTLAQLLRQRPLAVQARVMRVPGFFSRADYQAVLALRDEHWRVLGPPPRARRGW